MSEQRTIIVDVDGIPTVAMPRTDGNAPPINLYAVKLPVYGQHQDCRLIEQGPPIDASNIIGRGHNDDEDEYNVLSDHVYRTLFGVLLTILLITLGSFIVMKIVT